MPYLGAAECLEFHVALLRDTLQKTSLVGENVRLYLTDLASLPFDSDVLLFQQHGQDLGERMLHAMQDTLERYEKCVIIGIDSPAVPPEWIQNAFKGLDTHDVVLGPTEDGGYYLIGMSQPIDAPFRGIPWSTGSVLSNTLEVLQSQRVLLLNTSFDIDEPADLLRLHTEIESLDVPYLRHIKNFFATTRLDGRLPSGRD